MRHLLTAFICATLVAPVVWPVMAAAQEQSEVAGLAGSDRMAPIVAENAEAKIRHAMAMRDVELAMAKAALQRMVGDDEHHAKILARQRVFDVILTTLVIIITASGLILSGLQFHADLKEARAGKVNTLKLSREGLELSSSVIGLFVLAASMFFFYVYVARVYEIRPIQSVSDSEASSGSLFKTR